jgi:DNA (cytosine-5)-methyltransferase 1
MSDKYNKKIFGVSLFSSGGIGDIALRDSGVNVLVGNELLPERAELFRYNFPETEMLVGNIWKLEEKIISCIRQKLGEHELDILFATPPCQGMSKNGRGKLLNAVRKGQKPKHDERNRLIIPTISIAKQLKPRLLVMENVPEMINTAITKNGNPEDVINILDYIQDELGEEYSGFWEIVEFADYGVPQRRQRLITIFSRDQFIKETMNEYSSILPPQTHRQKSSQKLKPWVTVRDAIANLPPLDARNKQSAESKEIDFHRVPILDEDKYFWVRNTPLEKGAFDNQCINPNCKYAGNQTHSACLGKDGINRASKTTPIYCKKCGSLLPRPWVRVAGEPRLMKGYTSAYKRMGWDQPASTLTRNLSYACSDNKLHPEQNRVLSLYEAMVIHTISKFDYQWKRADGKKVSDKLIREVIGESIPPYGLLKIFIQLVKLLKQEEDVMPVHHHKPNQLSLYDQPANGHA